MTTRGRLPPRVLLAGILALAALPATAAPPTLTLVEEFDDTSLRDATRTRADWSAFDGALLLPRGRADAEPFPAGLTRVDETAVGIRPDAVIVGDVDGDGRADLVVAQGWLGGAGVYPSASAGPTFSATPAVTVEAGTGTVHATALADLDGDGDLDLVTGNRIGTAGAIGRASVYLNDSRSFPGGADLVHPFAAAYPAAFAVADFNRDGRPDLAMAEGEQGPNRVLLNLPGGGPVALHEIVLTAQSGPGTFHSSAVAAGDIDGDGDVDLISGGVAAATLLYASDGTRAPFGGVAPGVIDAVGGASALALGDLDGDADLDLVAGNSGSTNRLYLNDGSATPFTAGSDIGAETDPTTSLALRDVDHDGR